MSFNPVGDIKKWFSRVKEEAQKGIHSIKNAVNDGVKVVKKEATDGVAEVRHTATEATHKVQETIHEAEKDAVEAVQQASELITDGIDRIEDLIEQGILEKALHEFVKLLRKSRFTKPVKFPLGPIVLVLIEPDKKLDVIEQYIDRLPRNEYQIRQMIKDLEPAEINIKPLPFLDLEGGWDTSELTDKLIDEIFDTVRSVL